MPGGMPVNQTGRPEAVLTPEESDAFVELVKRFTGGGPDGGAGAMGGVNFNYFGTQYPSRSSSGCCSGVTWQWRSAVRADERRSLMATLPTDTRNVGQADPAADFDALVDVVSAITGVAPGGTVGTGQLIATSACSVTDQTGQSPSTGRRPTPALIAGGQRLHADQGRLSTSFSINSGVTLKPVGYRIFVQGTLTNNGTIAANGNNGSAAGTAGGATGNGTLGGGKAGGAGQTGNGSAGGNGAGRVSRWRLGRRWRHGYGRRGRYHDQRFVCVLPDGGSAAGGCCQCFWQRRCDCRRSWRWRRWRGRYQPRRRRRVRRRPHRDPSLGSRQQRHDERERGERRHTHDR